MARKRGGHGGGHGWYVTFADLMALPAQLPNPAPQAPEGLEELGSNVISWLKWITMIAGFGGLLWCGFSVVAASVGPRDDPIGLARRLVVARVVAALSVASRHRQTARQKISEKLPGNGAAGR
jgi:hypothetical protein